MRIFHHSRARGFTLVEIMIVVAIIALIVAIAIPNFLRARLNANENAAVANLRTVSTGCESFRAAQTPPTYPATLVALSTAVPAYIDATLGAGTKQGYNFAYVQVSANQYTANADPVTVGVTGNRHFFVDESGVIRSNPAAPAGPGDPPIG